MESASANIQHLSLQTEDLVASKSTEDNPAVIIPDHLQLANADCGHLSFGSFGSGAFSGLLPSKVHNLHQLIKKMSGENISLLCSVFMTRN